MSTRTSRILVPLMLVFFCMGFVDMVGIATNYVKADFSLSDTMANFLTSMVFLWFFIFSVPTGLLMNRIGRKKTVLLSLVVTLVAMALPVIRYNYPMMLVSFCLLGISNTLMQVSLNPLVACVVSGEKLSSTLTFGQFIKAICSFVTPLAAGFAAAKTGNWLLIYPVFLVITLIATVYLWCSRIDNDTVSEKTTSFVDCIKLLGNPTILLLFFAIVCNVGIDVGMNTSCPKLIMERIGLPLTEAGVATSFYFLFKTLGCVAGIFGLSKIDNNKYLTANAVLLILGMAFLFLGHSVAAIYIGIALAGFGNSTVFTIAFSKALLYMPERNNEISGLMIMGLIGGTIFPIPMGMLSDSMGSQVGSLIVISVGVLYVTFLAVSSLIRGSK